MLTTEQVISRAERCGPCRVIVTGDATQGEIADVTLGSGAHEVYARRRPSEGWQLVRSMAPTPAVEVVRE